MPIETLSAWTELDAATLITMGTFSAAGTVIPGNQQSCDVYKDFGVNYFASGTPVTFDVYLRGQTDTGWGSAIGVFYASAWAIFGSIPLIESQTNWFGLQTQRTTGRSWILRSRYTGSTQATTVATPAFSLNTDYYIRFVRDYTAGTLACYLYRDSLKTDCFQTISHTCCPGNLRLLHVMVGGASTFTSTWTGTIGTVDSSVSPLTTAIYNLIVSTYKAGFYQLERIFQSAYTTRSVFYKTFNNVWMSVGKLSKLFTSKSNTSTGINTLRVLTRDTNEVVTGWSFQAAMDNADYGFCLYAEDEDYMYSSTVGAECGGWRFENPFGTFTAVTGASLFVRARSFEENAKKIECSLSNGVGWNLVGTIITASTIPEWSTFDVSSILNSDAKVRVASLKFKVNELFFDTVAVDCARLEVTGGYKRGRTAIFSGFTISTLEPIYSMQRRMFKDMYGQKYTYIALLDSGGTLAFYKSRNYIDWTQDTVITTLNTLLWEGIDLRATFVPAYGKYMIYMVYSDRTNLYVRVGSLEPSSSSIQLGNQFILGSSQTVPIMGLDTKGYVWLSYQQFDGNYNIFYDVSKTILPVNFTTITDWQHSTFAVNAAKIMQIHLSPLLDEDDNMRLTTARYNPLSERNELYRQEFYWLGSAMTVCPIPQNIDGVSSWYPLPIERNQACGSWDNSTLTSGAGHGKIHIAYPGGYTFADTGNTFLFTVHRRGTPNGIPGTFGVNSPTMGIIDHRYTPQAISISQNNLLSEHREVLFFWANTFEPTRFRCLRNLASAQIYSLGMCEWFDNEVTGIIAQEEWVEPEIPIIVNTTNGLYLLMTTLAGSVQKQFSIVEALGGVVRRLFVGLNTVLNNVSNKFRSVSWTSSNTVKTMVSKYNIINLTESLGSLSYFIANRVNSTKVGIHNIISNTSRIINGVWNTRNNVLKGLSSVYNVANRVTSLITGIFNLTSTVQKLKTLVYWTRNLVSGLFTSTYYVHSLMDRLFTSIYSARQLATRTISGMHNIANTVKMWASMVYNVANAVPRKITSLYNTRQNVPKLLNGFYNISNRIASLKSGMYNTGGNVSRKLSGLYNTIKNVPRLIVGTYNTKNLVQSLRTGVYNVSKLVPKKISAYYNSINLVQRLSTAKYMLYNRAMKTFSSLYNATGVAIGLMRAVYGYGNSVFSLIVSRYNGIGITRKLLSQVSATYNRVRSTFTGTYDMRTLVSRLSKAIYTTFNSLWNTIVSVYVNTGLISTVTKLFKGVYSGIGRINTLFDLKYTARNTLQSLTSFVYDVKNRAQAILTSVYTVVSVIYTVLKYFAVRWSGNEVIYKTFESAYTSLVKLSVIFSGIYSSFSNVFSKILATYTVQGVVSRTIKLVYGGLLEVSNSIVALYNKLENLAGSFNLTYWTSSRVRSIIRSVYGGAGTVEHILLLLYNNSVTYLELVETLIRTQLTDILKRDQLTAITEVWKKIENLVERLRRSLS